MAVIEGRAQLAATVTIALTESEAGALAALTAYGVDPFLKSFYEHMGESVLRPYEDGLRSLFKSIRDGECGIKSVLARASEAREVFSGKKIAAKKEV